MYETEKALARIDFVSRFRWNSKDGALLRSRVSETRNCVFCLTPPGGGEEVLRTETTRFFDFEDDQSGGFPLCDEHASELVFESDPQPEWVSQDAAQAWDGPDQRYGWSDLWFLFAPEGKYAKDGVWPYEEAGR